MLYISSDGDAVKTGTGYESALSIYDDWMAGKKEYEILTSGSTGKPKTIKLSRKAIQASIAMTSNQFDLKSDDSFLCNLNTDYIAGLMMLLRAAEIGCEIVVIKPDSNPLNSIGAHKDFLLRNPGKIFLAFVPMQLRNVINDSNNINLLLSAKAIIVGGAAVAEDIIEKIKLYNLPVYETYGMTETISHIAVKDLRKDKDYFTILEGVSIDTDQEGCLKVQSPSTLGKWIQTNDVVDILSTNTFKLKGRRDNIINSGGIKIQLEEVEKLIEPAIPNGQNYFLYGQEDKVLGEKLVLYVEGTKINFEELKNDLPPYKKPKEVVYLQNFIRTPSGKIDKLKTVAGAKK